MRYSFLPVLKEEMIRLSTKIPQNGFSRAVVPQFPVLCECFWKCPRPPAITDLFKGIIRIKRLSRLQNTHHIYITHISLIKIKYILSLVTSRTPFFHPQQRFGMQLESWWSYPASRCRTQSDECSSLRRKQSNSGGLVFCFKRCFEFACTRVFLSVMKDMQWAGIYSLHHRATARRDSSQRKKRLKPLIHQNVISKMFALIEMQPLGVFA